MEPFGDRDIMPEYVAVAIGGRQELNDQFQRIQTLQVELTLAKYNLSLLKAACYAKNTKQNDRDVKMQKKYIEIMENDMVQLQYMYKEMSQMIFNHVEVSEARVMKFMYRTCEGVSFESVWADIHDNIRHDYCELFVENRDQILTREQILTDLVHCHVARVLYDQQPEKNYAKKKESLEKELLQLHSEKNRILQSFKQANKQCLKDITYKLCKTKIR